MAGIPLLLSLALALAPAHAERRLAPAPTGEGTGPLAMTLESAARCGRTGRTDCLPALARQALDQMAAFRGPVDTDTLLDLHLLQAASAWSQGQDGAACGSVNAARRLLSQAPPPPPDPQAASKAASGAAPASPSEAGLPGGTASWTGTQASARAGASSALPASSVFYSLFQDPTLARRYDSCAASEGSSLRVPWPERSLLVLDGEPLTRTLAPTVDQAVVLQRRSPLQPAILESRYAPPGTSLGGTPSRLVQAALASGVLAAGSLAWSRIGANQFDETCRVMEGRNDEACARSLTLYHATFLVGVGLGGVALGAGGAGVAMMVR